MRVNTIKTLGLAVASIIILQSCTKDLDLAPKYGLNAESVYEDPDNYILVLAKLYAGLAVSGNEGPAGNPDVQGLDEGFGQYTRGLWNLQELPTDETTCRWGDTGIPELNVMTWDANNGFTKTVYSRIYFQLTSCNDFIRQCEDEKLDDRGFSDSEKTAIRLMRNEARFLRALSYWHAIDLFGSVPFITEEDGIGSFLPEQRSRTFIYDYVVSELRDLENNNLLNPAGSNNNSADYGRADLGAAQFLLAKLYLNSEVYTGTPRYTQAAEYSQKVIDAYSLCTQGTAAFNAYERLFLSDNDMSPAKDEIVFPVRFDGLNTQTWGGGTFLVHAFVGGTMDPDDFGINGGWQGYRAREAFASKFYGLDDDGRKTLYTDGVVDSTITAINAAFNVGIAIAKYRNVDSDGLLPADTDPQGNHVNMDFPMFRAADAYLMYAECAARGAADAGMGLMYMNQLRERAYGDDSGNLSTLPNLQGILDERALELHWEGHRRTDLIRFGQFTTGDYLWEFKGNDAQGTAVSSHLRLYPLSADDVIANPNLTQNDGY